MCMWHVICVENRCGVFRPVWATKAERPRQQVLQISFGLVASNMPCNYLWVCGTSSLLHCISG